MNDYEGLNLPQLLALMHDVVLPEAVSLMPASPGWWVLLGWFAASVLVLVRSLVRRRRANAYRRDALQLLAAIETDRGIDDDEAAARIADLVKRTALAAYPRRTVAPLYGADWARFLCATAGNDRKVTAAADELAHAAYRPGGMGRQLVEPARRWIRVHRA